MSPDQHWAKLENSQKCRFMFGASENINPQIDRRCGICRTVPIIIYNLNIEQARFCQQFPYLPGGQLNMSHSNCSQKLFLTQIKMIGEAQYGSWKAKGDIVCGVYHSTRIEYTNIEGKWPAQHSSWNQKSDVFLGEQEEVDPINSVTMHEIHQLLNITICLRS